MLENSPALREMNGGFKVLHQWRNYNVDNLLRPCISSKFEQYKDERYWEYEYDPNLPPWYVRCTYKGNITARASATQEAMGPWLECAPGTTVHRTDPQGLNLMNDYPDISKGCKWESWKK